MILVDSSVWIDFLRGRATPQSLKLKQLIGEVEIAVGDLILTEVLQCTIDSLKTVSMLGGSLIPNNKHGLS